MSSTRGYYLGLQTGSGSQSHVEDLFVWEMGGEHWQSWRALLAIWQSGREALPTGVLGKGRHVSKASRHGHGFRELNENSIFLEQLGQNPVCIVASRFILIIQPSKRNHCYI